MDIKYIKLLDKIKRNYDNKDDNVKHLAIIEGCTLLDRALKKEEMEFNSSNTSNDIDGTVNGLLSKADELAFILSLLG